MYILGANFHQGSSFCQDRYRQYWMTIFVQQEGAFGKLIIRKLQMAKNRRFSVSMRNHIKRAQTINIQLPKTDIIVKTGLNPMCLVIYYKLNTDAIFRMEVGVSFTDGTRRKISQVVILLIVFYGGIHDASCIHSFNILHFFPCYRAPGRLGCARRRLPELERTNDPRLGESGTLRSRGRPGRMFELSRCTLLHPSAPARLEREPRPRSPVPCHQPHLLWVRHAT